MGLRDLLNVALSSVGDKTSDWWRGRGGRLSSAGSSPPPPRVSWGLPTAVLRALWGTQSTQDPRAERNLLAKSENVPKAGLHSQSHARMLC